MGAIAIDGQVSFDFRKCAAAYRKVFSALEERRKHRWPVAFVFAFGLPFPAWRWRRAALGPMHYITPHREETRAHESAIARVFERADPRPAVPLGLPVPAPVGGGGRYIGIWTGTPEGLFSREVLYHLTADSAEVPAVDGEVAHIRVVARHFRRGSLPASRGLISPGRGRGRRIAHRVGGLRL